MPRTGLQEGAASGQPGPSAEAAGQQSFGGAWGVASYDRPAASKPPAPEDAAGAEVPDGTYGPSTEGPEDVADLTGPAPGA
eukprot:4070389-Alexandrium_andersonii.AAC.1